MKRAFLILICVAVIGCGKEPMAPSRSGNFSIGVSVATVAREPLTETLNFVGDLKAEEEVTLFSKVSGKLVEYLLEEGSAVKKEEPVARVDRDEVGFKYQKAPVLSTIDGTVGRTYLDPGDDVREDTAVALIVHLEKMHIQVAVIERYLPRIVLGQKARVRVDAFPDRVFEAEVFKVSPVIDIATRTAPIELKVPNLDHALKPGMFAHVEIIVREYDNEVMIPEESVVAIEGKTFVYVVADSMAHRQAVRLGIRRPGKVQVLDGLHGGEKIVIAGHQKIADGSKVFVKE